MGKYGEHHGGNYDVKKLQNLLPKRYTFHGIQKKRKMVEKYYAKGQIIEAFAVLYAITEQQLLEVFKMRLQAEFAPKPWIDLESKHEWEYAQLIRVLNEINVLTDNEYQKFKLFQDGRHKAVHQLPLPHLHDKITKNNMDNSFNAGLQAYDIAESKAKKIIHESFSRIDWEKDGIEVEKYLRKATRQLKEQVKKQSRK